MSYAFIESQLTEIPRSIYNTNLRFPLIIAAPPPWPTGLRETRILEMIDKREAKPEIEGRLRSLGYIDRSGLG